MFVSQEWFLSDLSQGLPDVFLVNFLLLCVHLAFGLFCLVELSVAFLFSVCLLHHYGVGPLLGAFLRDLYWLNFDLIMGEDWEYYLVLFVKCCCGFCLFLLGRYSYLFNIIMESLVGLLLRFANGFCRLYYFEIISVSKLLIKFIKITKFEYDISHILFEFLINFKTNICYYSNHNNSFKTAKNE